MGLFRSLSHRPFALLWGGQTLSRLGDSIFAIALAWWVLAHTGSAAAMGTVLICISVPTLLFLLAGGVAVDRLPRLAVMLAADFLRGVVVSVVAVLAATGTLALWHLYVLGAVFGLVQAFFSPAYTATVPDLLPSEALPSANSLRSISWHLAGIIGPAAGGAVVAGGGTSLAFALDGLSFLASAACILAVGRLPALARPPSHPAGILGDLAAGFRTVRDSPWLWVTMLVAGASTLFLVGPQGAVLPLLARQHLRAGVGGFALLNATEAVGALLAAAWLGQRARLRHRGILLYVSWLCVGLGMAVMGLPVSLAAAAAALFAVGACTATLGIIWTNTMQECVPGEQLGRVASIDALVSEALVPVGFGVAGIAADRLGAAPVFVIGGLIGAAIVGAGLLHPAVRGMD